MHAWRLVWFVVAVVLLPCWFSPTLAVCADEQQISFRSDIAPVLQEHCVACHGARKAEGGYRADTYAEAFKAGDSGATPFVVADDGSHGLPDESEFLRRLTCEDPYERMPAETDPLNEEQIARIRTWIEQGAKFDGSDPAALLTFVIPPQDFSPPPANYPTAVPVTAVAIHPTNHQIYTGGYHEVLVWNTDGQLQQRISNLGQRIYALRWNADATLLAVACGEPGRYGEVRLVDPNTGNVQAVVGRSADVVLDVAFRPSSDELAIAAADNLIRIVNVKTGDQVREYASHADWVTAIAWNEDGSKLASASRDKSVKVFDAASGQLLVNYQGHGAPVRGVTFLAGGEELISSSSAGSLHRWKIAEGKRVAEIRIGGEGYHLVRIENTIYVPCADKKVFKVDVNENKVTATIEGHQDWVLSSACQPGHPQLVTGGFDGEVRVTDLTNNTLIHQWIAKP